MNKLPQRRGVISPSAGHGRGCLASLVMGPVVLPWTVAATRGPAGALPARQSAGRHGGAGVANRSPDPTSTPRVSRRWPAASSRAAVRERSEGLPAIRSTDMENLGLCDSGFFAGVRWGEFWKLAPHSGTTESELSNYKIALTNCARAKAVQACAPSLHRQVPDALHQVDLRNQYRALRASPTSASCGRSRRWTGTGPCRLPCWHSQAAMPRRRPHGRPCPWGWH